MTLWVTKWKSTKFQWVFGGFSVAKRSRGFNFWYPNSLIATLDPLWKNLLLQLLKARPILLLLFQVLFKFQFQVPSSRLVQGYGDIITYPSISVGDLLRSIRALPWGGDHSGYFVTRRECTDLHVLERRVVGGLIACKITNTKWHYKLSYR